MKFDGLLASYLYEYRLLPLQELGTFQLDRSITPPPEQENDNNDPLEGLTYTYNPREQTSEDVIAYLVKKLGKIQPLVRSDLESYLTNIKHFLNIGKPYTIEGIGTLLKNNSGEYEFTPGNAVAIKEEPINYREKLRVNTREPKEEAPALKYERHPRSGGSKTFLIVAIILLVTGGITWGIYYMLATKTPMVNTSPYPDTLNDAHKDGMKNRVVTRPADTLFSAAPAGDTGRYKFIFETTASRQRMSQRTGQLRNFGTDVAVDSQQQSGTTMYRLYVSQRLHYNDTARVKDSISRFLGRRVSVEPNR